MAQEGKLYKMIVARQAATSLRRAVITSAAHRLDGSLAVGHLPLGAAKAAGRTSLRHAPSHADVNAFRPQPRRRRGDPMSPGCSPMGAKSKTGERTLLPH